MAHSAAACTHKPGSTAGHVEPLTSFNGAYSVSGPAGTAACTNKPGSSGGHVDFLFNTFNGAAGYGTPCSDERMSS